MKFINFLFEVFNKLKNYLLIIAFFVLVIFMIVFFNKKIKTFEKQISKYEQTINNIIDENNKNKILYINKFNDIIENDKYLKNKLDKIDIKKIEEINKIYYYNTIKDTVIINYKEDSIKNEIYFDTIINCIAVKGIVNKNNIDLVKLNFLDTIYLIEKEEREKVKILFFKLKIGKKIRTYNSFSKCGDVNSVNIKKILIK